MIDGYATLEGTERYFSKIERTYPNLITNSWYSRILQLDFLPSRLGFGSYRIHYQQREHANALREALVSGINVIDTATNYGDGASEILIGNIIKELIDSYRLKRDEVIVISKAGFVQGKNLRLYLDQNFPDMFQLDNYLYYCIHPDFLEIQIELSRKRLGLKTIDVFLLHNPEYLLKKGNNKIEFLNKIEKALNFLEKKRNEGLIRFYGISSNTLVESPFHPEYIDLRKILKIAPPAFKVIQFPANLLEMGFITNYENQGSVLEIALKNNLWIIGNRPFNAIHDSKLYRLARMPFNSGNDEKNPEAIFLNLEDQLKDLENQLVLGLSSFHFQFDNRYPSPYETIQYYSKYINEPEMTFPFMRSISIPFQKTVSYIKLLIHDSKSEKLKQLYEDYIRVLNYTLIYLPTYIAYKNHLQLEELEKNLMKEEPYYSSLPLTLQILTILLSNGIHTVLAGMRRTMYVRQLQKIFTVKLLNKKIVVDKNLIINSKL